MMFKLTSLSTIFQLYRGGQFYWWRKQKYLEKTTDYHKTLTKFFFKDLRKVDYTIFVLCATNKNVLRIFVVV